MRSASEGRVRTAGEDINVCDPEPERRSPGNGAPDNLTTLPFTGIRGALSSPPVSVGRMQFPYGIVGAPVSANVCIGLKDKCRLATDPEPAQGCYRFSTRADWGDEPDEGPEPPTQAS